MGPIHMLVSYQQRARLPGQTGLYVCIGPIHMLVSYQESKSYCRLSGQTGLYVYMYMAYIHVHVYSV